MPDGTSIVLERQPGADTEGYAGLEDEVDNHWGILFNAAVLSTLLSAGAEAGTSQDENNLVQAIGSGASNSISQIGQQIVQRQLNRTSRTRASRSRRLRRSAGPDDGTGCSGPRKADCSNPDVVGSPVGLVPPNAHLVSV